MKCHTIDGEVAVNKLDGDCGLADSAATNDAELHQMSILGIALLAGLRGLHF